MKHKLNVLSDLHHSFEIPKKMKKVDMKKVYNSLSDAAHDLLEHVKDTQLDDLYDSRGVYVEHDRHECKPFDSKVVKEVCKSGLVKVHEDSDDFKGGVAFLKVKKKYLNLVEQ